MKKIYSSLYIQLKYFRRLSRTVLYWFPIISNKIPAFDKNNMVMCLDNARHPTLSKTKAKVYDEQPTNRGKQARCYHELQSVNNIQMANYDGLTCIRSWRRDCCSSIAIYVNLSVQPIFGKDNLGATKP